MGVLFFNVIFVFLLLRIVIVMGGNIGIGYEIVKVIVWMGVRVIIVCCLEERVKEVFIVNINFICLILFS